MSEYLGLIRWTYKEWPFPSLGLHDCARQHGFHMSPPSENMPPGHVLTAKAMMCGQRRPRSDCADAQSDQGLHCPLT